MQRLIEAGLAAGLILTTVPAYATPTTPQTQPSTPPTDQPVDQPVATPNPPPSTLEANQGTMPPNADPASSLELSERDRLILERRQQRRIPTAD